EDQPGNCGKCVRGGCRSSFGIVIPGLAPVRGGPVIRLTNLAHAAARFPDRKPRQAVWRGGRRFSRYPLVPRDAAPFEFRLAFEIHATPRPAQLICVHTSRYLLSGP